MIWWDILRPDILRPDILNFREKTVWASALPVFFLEILSPSSPILGHNWKHDLARSCFILKISISGLKISVSGLKIWISGLKISISGLKILISGLKIWISSLNISISGQRNSGPPPEGIVPNFEPKNDLKKGQICVFGLFLGPNGPFRLFSHHILCPMGLMKE